MHGAIFANIHASSIGDVIDAFMAMMVLRTCQQVEGGLPSGVKSKMMFNIILDFGIGLVPFIGDLADGKYHKDHHARE
jgi:hypothetical protein